MACGCQNTCGCHILDDGGVTTRVAQKGDTFTIYAIPVIAGVESTDCIALEIDEDKTLHATPILADGETVELECTEDGLRAEVVIDPSSTAIVTASPAGLKVDVPPTPGVATSGLAPGDIVPFAGIRLPANRVECYGQPMQASTYPEAYDALTLFGTSATTTDGSAIVTGLDNTRFIEPGMTVTGTGFSIPAEVVSVDSPTQITVDAPADYTVVGAAEIRVHVWGFYAVDPSFFLAPDLRDSTIAGMGDMGSVPIAGAAPEGLLLGGKAGANDAEIGVASLPLHDHPADGVDAGHFHLINDPGHDHGGLTSANGGHGHSPPDNGAFTQTDKSRRFVVVGNGDPADHPLTPVSVSNDGVNTPYSIPVGPSEGGGTIYAQGTTAFTQPVGDHQHVIASDLIGITQTEIGAADITVTVHNAGSATPDPIDLRQPTTYMRLTMVV